MDANTTDEQKRIVVDALEEENRQKPHDAPSRLLTALRDRVTVLVQLAGLHRRGGDRGRELVFARRAGHRADPIGVPAVAGLVSTAGNPGSLGQARD